MSNIGPFFFNMAGVCDFGMEKDWITPTICIGNAQSSYKAFDIVVNANYPPNRFKHGCIARREEKLDEHECTLYLVGLYDDDSEPILEYINMIIPKLRTKYVENPMRKFLFHCYAGKSRSVVLALAFMVEVVGITFDDAFSLIKKKRPIIKPRPLFIEALQTKYNVIEVKQ